MGDSEEEPIERDALSHEYSTREEVEVEEDLLNVPESPAQVDVRNLLETNDSPPIEAENEPNPGVDREASAGREDVQHNVSELFDVQVQPTPEVELDGEISTEEEAAQHMVSELDDIEIQPTTEITARTEETRSPEMKMDTPGRKEAASPTPLLTKVFVEAKDINNDVPITEENISPEMIVDTLGHEDTTTATSSLNEALTESCVEPECTEKDSPNKNKIDSPEKTVLTPRLEEKIALNPSIVEVLTDGSTQTKNENDDAPMLQEKTPKSVTRQMHAKAIATTGVESPQGLNSPQIGTTLLKRESLRSRGSPRKRSSAKKNSTPKIHGLKKRDTLQEREILQQFNAASTPSNATASTNLLHEAGNRSPSKVSPTHSIAAQDNKNQAAASPGPCKDEIPLEASVDTQIGDLTVEQIVLKDKDIARAIEAIEVCQSPKDGPSDAGFNDAALSAESANNINEANDFIARSEVQEAVQSVVAVCEDLEVPARKTRSGARISDDTSMLKDFLNRAQAKKAAKNVPLLSAEVPILQSSPTRRSPRKALEPQPGDIGSPQKKKKSTKSPSTPPRKILVEENDSFDDPEAICEPTSFRRSTRTRLPAPSKTPPGAPTFIPVRRGEGSDPIVLQKSQAQEMAVVTRANTRRNKGQSKPPALALQELPPESPVKLTTSKERADHAKKVAWAERLASFQESKEAPEEPEDQQQKPKVRRMRGLGAVNGTPAKKSTAMAPSSNGTPAPKRRSKTR